MKPIISLMDVPDARVAQREKASWKKSEDTKHEA
jgi:hypothetical protein